MVGVTLEVLPDAEALAERAAGFIAARIRQNPRLNVLVATGNTPMATYARLAGMVAAGELDCSRITAFQLDEYVGLGVRDRRSLLGWMERSFVTPLGVGEVVALGDPTAFDAEVAARGGIDLAILGLGPNGHLGFNEPPSPPDAPTREVRLTPESLSSNRAYWGELGVPELAVTAGMNVILAAHETLLLVAGAHKRAVLHAALSGPETPDLPASYLRRSALTVLADREAAPGGSAP